jgi:hypothetical protein
MVPEYYTLMFAGRTNVTSVGIAMSSTGVEPNLSASILMYTPPSCPRLFTISKTVGNSRNNEFQISMCHSTAFPSSEC